MIHHLFTWWAKQFEGKDIDQCVAEWHCFWSGFAIGFTLQGYGYPLTEEAWAELKREEHYYHTGRGVGRGVVLVLIAALIAWIRQ